MTAILTTLEAHEAISKEKKDLVANGDVDMTVYVGPPGRGMEVRHVKRISVGDKVTSLHYSPGESQAIVRTDDISAVTVKGGGTAEKSSGPGF